MFRRYLKNCFSLTLREDINSIFLFELFIHISFTFFIIIFIILSTLIKSKVVRLRISHCSYVRFLFLICILSFLTGSALYVNIKLFSDSCTKLYIILHLSIEIVFSLTLFCHDFAVKDLINFSYFKYYFLLLYFNILVNILFTCIMFFQVDISVLSILILHNLSQLGYLIMYSDKLNLSNKLLSLHSVAFNKLGFTYVWQMIRNGSLLQISSVDNLLSITEDLSPNNFMIEFKCFNRCKALFSLFKNQLIVITILKLLSLVASLLFPIILNNFVVYMTLSDSDIYSGLLFLFGFLFNSVIFSLSSVYFNYYNSKLSLNLKSKLIPALFHNILGIPYMSMTHINNGQLLDYLTVDVDRIANFFQSFQELWSMPLQIIISTFLLYKQVGISSFAGIVFILILIPINKVLANKIGFYSSNFMIKKDGRMKILSDLLQSILTIKVGCFENIYFDKINDQRKFELNYLKKQKYLDACCVIFWSICPVIICSSTFTLYTYLGNTITSAKVLTSFSLFNLLIGPMNSLPWVINGIVEALISLRRINSIAIKDDGNLSVVRDDHKINTCHSLVEMKGAWFSWNRNWTESDLHATALFKNVNLQIEKNEYIGIIGSVGSGKSSFLLTMLGEVCHTRGTLKLSDELTKYPVAYVSQKPWLIKRSIKENIIMFENYDLDWYSKVVLSCGLDKDFDNMQMGDRTKVADEGVSLSGGQKARICLARAVYHRANVYLLDDPLSSLDNKVSKLIVEEVISKLLANVTIIMVSNNVKLFSKFKSNVRVPDKLFVINDGNIEQISIVEDNDLTISSIDAEFNLKVINQDQSIGNESIPVLNNDQVSPEKEEHMEIGSIKKNVYFGYIKLVGLCMAVIVVVSLFVMQATKNCSEYWLAFWSSSANGNHSYGGLLHVPLWSRVWNNVELLFIVAQPDDAIAYFLYIYLAIVSVNILSSVIRAFSFAIGGIRASYRLHKKLLSALMQAKLEFFEQTPRGRILNRFTSDISTVDDNLPFIFNIFLANLFACLGCLILVSASLPLIGAIIIPLIYVCYYYQYFYRITSRVVKRLISVNRSPLYSNYSEMIDGMIFIRNYRLMPQVMRDTKNLLLNLIRCEYSGLLLSSWLSLRLQLIGIVFITAVIIISLLANYFNVINKSLIGLACVYSFTFTNLLSTVIVSATESEKEFVAVERCLEYIPSKDNVNHIPLESATSDSCCENFVENEGGTAVEIRNVYLRYVPNDSFALSDVSLKIEARSNVGVIGRTGSGKSSLIKLLFRLVSFDDHIRDDSTRTGYCGKILINGTETQCLNLHSLRSNMSFMLQDSVIFSDTIRHNLDPNNEHSDQELLEVVQKIQLTQCFQDNVTVDGTFNLYTPISNCGRELSYGQQQLLSLGRVLLSRNNIVCLDEPSAHLDSLTEAVIEKVIVSEFIDKTVIIIGHRLPMLLKVCDTILILNNGHVIEYGLIKDLLQNPESYLAQYLSEL